VHLTAKPGQHVELNTARIPIRADNEPFTFSVTTNFPPGSEGSGYFAVFFLTAKRELSRTMIFFDPPPVKAGMAVTTSDGKWSITLPGKALPPYSAEARYRGDSQHRSTTRTATTAETSEPGTR
jgi:hypothetical protein